MINNLPSTGDVSGPLLPVLHAITHLTFTIVISFFTGHWSLERVSYCPRSYSLEVEPRSNPRSETERQTMLLITTPCCLLIIKWNDDGGHMLYGVE